MDVIFTSLFYLFLLDTSAPGGDMFNVMMKSVPGASMSAVCMFSSRVPDESAVR